MFAELSSSRKSIGDVDVIFHDGIYHLFHLVLPNHDYIAHAISENGLNWRRVTNALFIGDPGSWDDLMLWTMHVSEDPHKGGSWRMFYTGLSRCDQGLVQRVGLAVSENLYNWTKFDVDWEDRRGSSDPECIKAEQAEHSARSTSSRVVARQRDGSGFPLVAELPHYESKVEEPRKWISFRDPFFYHDSQHSWLLSAARVNEGPMVRRGCVGLMEEVSPNQFESRPALFAPTQYDDIEVPSLFRMEDDYYLLGSLREDQKIRYWHNNELNSAWKNFADNVLLPKGNYAGRISRDASGWLLWNFYNTNIQKRTANNIMPPPKRIKRAADGQLQVRTFEGIKERVTGTIDTRFTILENGAGDHVCKTEQDTLTVGSTAGFKMFTLAEQVDCFILSCSIEMVESGKSGIVVRLDPDSRDGYYFSLDLIKGVASCRSWSTKDNASGDEMMQFTELQAGFWVTSEHQAVDVHLVSFGSYHELSIDGQIVLSLVDSAFGSGLFGFYVETAKLSISGLKLERLKSPTQSDAHLTHGPHS